MEASIWLGSKVRDKITGFSGIVTGFATYITGCNQLLVQPSIDKDGKWVDSLWMDEDRLELEEETDLGIKHRGLVGADKPAPKK